MTTKTEAFLADMILRLVPFGAKVIHEGTGNQVGDNLAFTKQEVVRLVSIKNGEDAGCPDDE